MQTNDAAPLPLSARVNQLFATFHTRAEAEQAVEDVTSSVSARLHRAVPVEELVALRAGQGDNTPADPQLLAALAQHFQVPEVYLTGDDAIVAGIDKELRLLAAARDAGVRNLVLRGEEVDINELGDQFKRLADNDPPA
ncbi:hypothetical protein [Nocardia brasiliensis]|uniref:hypothetical protein n=1 Tax=Nocardia brasiliensis TaxID=37326 RepID=UPI00245614ED|nr:hypothetical protein [Nocardia brasiliensis]